jgi:flagellar hook-associated protein FlgK
MELNKINNRIRKKSLKSSTEFLNTYLDHEDQIIDALSKLKGIKTELYLKEINSELQNLIRFSTIFSDLTILNNTTSSITNSHVTYFEPESKYYQDRKLTFPASEFNIFSPDVFEMSPCYIYRSDEEVKKIAKLFGPLINSNRLLVRPLRGVYAHNKITNENILHYVNPNTDNKHWLVDNVIKDEYFFIDNGLSFSEVMKLFELTLPYFTEIKLETLNKILEDEADLLSSFRNNLKNLIKEGQNNFKSLKELQQDLLNPEIEKINRRFKKIKSLHKLTVGGIVGSFTLSLLLGVYEGTEIIKLLSSFLPAGGLVASEIKFQDDIDILKDNGFYLLWRINSKQ